VKRLYTDYLAASGSILIGMGSALNLAGVGYFTYNRAASPRAADAIAIRQDFAMIGQDINDTVAAVDADPALLES
jgi:hypothetical protein